jgi:hypothetical protein
MCFVIALLSLKSFLDTTKWFLVLT